MLQIEIHSPDLEKEVNALVDSGLYPDPHAVMVDALENLVRIKNAISSFGMGKIDFHKF